MKSDEAEDVREQPDDAKKARTTTKKASTTDEVGKARAKKAKAADVDKGFAGLPQDPEHPLYSPLTVDGNKS
jgi:hypothetical protein